jgi:hypothetical protein
MTTRTNSRGRPNVASSLVAAVVACSRLTEQDSVAPRANVVLAPGACVSQRAVTPPFVSVVDSVHVVVRSGDGTVFDSTGTRLSRYRLEDTLALSVPPGEAVFSARVLSNKRVVLFSGETPSPVPDHAFSVTIALCPERPVLVVVADTARPMFGDSIRGSFLVYNRGSMPLAWNVVSVDTAFTRCGLPCDVRPMKGSVAVGDSQSLTLTIPSIPPFTRRLFAFELSSPEGNVPLAWEVTAAPVIGVTVSPNPSLVQAGQTAQLIANVEVSGGNVSPVVTWTGPGSGAATVSAAGVVRGVGSGLATITATSIVDRTKSGSTSLRVYSATAPSGYTWSITAPSTATILSRDDAAPGTHAVAVTARADGPPNVFQNPFPNGVEFWARPGPAGTWRRIGTTNNPVLTQTAVARSWAFTIVWNPDAVDAPFANPSSTVMQLIATGITTINTVIASSIDTNVTIRVP